MRRATPKPPVVVSVETLPCPGGGLHVLTKRSQRGDVLVTCSGCAEPWETLDAIARAAVVTVPHVRHENTPRPVVVGRGAA